MLGLVLLLLGSALAGDPNVFGDYFDDEIRFVDIPQDVALTACLDEGSSTAQKVTKAYDGCFGEDYSFDDLAETDGPDKDGDDLPDKFEGNEACFYEKMNWVSKNLKEVDPAAIKADMEGLPNAVAEQFNANIDSCAAWSGSFGANRRNKREVEDVPSLMEAGSRAMGWVKVLVRKTRSAVPAKKDGKKAGEGKGKGNDIGAKKGDRKGKNKGNSRGAKKGDKKGKNEGNSRGAKKGDKKGKNKGNSRGAKKGDKKGKNKGNSRGGKKGDGKGKNKGNRKVNGKGGKDNGNDKGEKKKGNGKGKGEGNGNGKKGNNERNNGKSGKEELKEETYNQLWCFDLALEQALEKCVEDKIKN